MGLSHRNKFLFIFKPLNFDPAMYILKKRANRQSVQPPITRRHPIVSTSTLIKFKVGFKFVDKSNGPAYMVFCCAVIFARARELGEKTLVEENC